MVAGPFVVPLRCGLEETCPRRQVPLDCILVECEPKPGLIRNGDVPFVDDGLFDALHEVLPPGDIQPVIFQRQEVLRRRRAVNGRRESASGCIRWACCRPYADRQWSGIFLSFRWRTLAADGYHTNTTATKGHVRLVSDCGDHKSSPTKKACVLLEPRAHS